MKDKFRQLIEAMIVAMGDLTGKVNTVIKDLPPVEQVETANLVLSLKRDLGWVIKDIERASESTTLDAVDQMLASFQSEVIAAAIADKTVIAAAELELRIEAAQNAVRATVEQEFKAAAEKVTTIASRRATIVADLGDVVAAQFTDEMIIADSFDTELARAKSAFERIKEKNIDAEKAPKAFAFVAASVLKPDAEFTAALELAVEAAAVKPTAGAAGVVVHAAAGKPESGNAASKLPSLVKAY